MLAGNVIGPNVDWSQQVKPALSIAAVLKPDAVTGVATGTTEPVEDEAWDAQNADFVEQEAITELQNWEPDDATPVTAAVGLPDSAEPVDPDLVEALRRTNLYRRKHQVSGR